MQKKDPSENRLQQERLNEGVAVPEAAITALNASFKEIASFGTNWDLLEEEGKKLRIQNIVKEITVFKEMHSLALQYLETPLLCLASGYYMISFSLPRHLSIKYYPESPMTFGERPERLEWTRGFRSRSWLQSLE